LNWVEHYKSVKHRIVVEAPMKSGKIVITRPTVTILRPEVIFPEKEKTPDDVLTKGLYPKRFIPHLLPMLREYEIPFEELRSERRFAKYQIPRFRMYHHLRVLGYSLSEIGGVFNRDHTSILHGIRRWKEINGE
jgi:hypothetical protein